MTNTSAPYAPPFCPRVDCPYHICADGWTWKPHGTYTRRCEPRVIRRFRCGHCRRTFSTQSFSTTYYLKRPELLAATFHRVLACSAFRQIAREARCAATTIQRQCDRLGRHALLMLQHLRPRGPVAEPIAIDGFESFAYSQYHPLHLNTAVGAESHFVYAFTFSELRRKGRMTERQRRRRAAIESTRGLPDPRAIELGVAALLALAAPEPQVLVVRSDEHEAYPRAIRRLNGWTIRHERTSSLEARTPGNPLFPVNLLDLLLRHNSANHKRETIAFSKLEASVVYRAAVLVLWRNFTKSFSERRGGGTPAMRLGLQKTPLSVKRLLRERLFPSRVALSAEWTIYYRRAIGSREITNARRHALKRAD